MSLLSSVVERGGCGSRSKLAESVIHPACILLRGRRTKTVGRFPQVSPPRLKDKVSGLTRTSWFISFPVPLVVVTVDNVCCHHRILLDVWRVCNDNKIMSRSPTPSPVFSAGHLPQLWNPHWSVAVFRISLFLTAWAVRGWNLVDYTLVWISLLFSLLVRWIMSYEEETHRRVS